MHRLVGLGGECQVAHQIRRLAPDSEAHYFDWLITPLDAAIALIDNQFSQILEQDHLEPEWNGDVLGKVVDTRYGIWYVHDGGMFEPADIDKMQNKYSYLRKKFLAMLADDFNTTFIRSWHPVDPILDIRKGKLLLEKIQKWKPNSRLVFLHKDAELPRTRQGNFLTAYLPPSETWMGDNAAWEDLILKFPEE